MFCSGSMTLFTDFDISSFIRNFAKNLIIT